MKFLSIVSSPLSYRLHQRLKAEARVRELREEEARILAAFPELRRRPRVSISHAADPRQADPVDRGGRSEAGPLREAHAKDVCWCSLPGSRRPM